MNVLSIDTISRSQESTILTVSELTSQVKRELEGRFPSILVKGEISNFKPTSSGHLYFDLKDTHAKIPAVIFRGSTSHLLRPPKEGDQVIVRGSLTVYPPHGRYQLIITELQYQGVGELLLKLEELKKKLKEKGWFDQTRKRPLPKFPKRIGVVTSPTGAVIRDIIQVLTRRAKGFHLLLNPVRVQGAEAASEIAEAIRQFNQHELADVLIVGRGGGSLEDLWPFNEEIVAQAIFESKIPIISAVGHETDFTIADFVADVRAPTPSAAAEIVLAERREYLTSLEKSQLSLIRTLSLKIQNERARLSRFLSHPLIAKSNLLLFPYLQKRDEIERELNRTLLTVIERKKAELAERARAVKGLRPDLILSLHREKVKALNAKLNDLIHLKFTFQKEKIKQISSLLVSLDPKKVLKRGYTILFDQKGGSAIVSASQLRENEKIFALLSDGEAELSVISAKQGGS